MSAAFVVLLVLALLALALLWAARTGRALAWRRATERAVWEPLPVAEDEGDPLQPTRLDIALVAKLGGLTRELDRQPVTRIDAVPGDPSYPREFTLALDQAYRTAVRENARRKLRQQEGTR